MLLAIQASRGIAHTNQQAMLLLISFHLIAASLLLTTTATAPAPSSCSIP
mgnify:CR=1 FL=1